MTDDVEGPMVSAEQRALAMDAVDPLASFRERFHIPADKAGEQSYFCGNSLGLMPKSVDDAVQSELDDWRRFGVEAHFRGSHPWFAYHEEVRDDLALVAGAEPIEVVAMNSLTVNLHLLMVGFYRPTQGRAAILIERAAFPSDRFAVESQIRFHGFDPAHELIELEPDEPGGTVSMAALERAFAEHGSRLALALLPGVQYLTGQRFDLRECVRLARRAGCAIGFDLAHAAGNVPLDLHDSGADFAAWCSYKYLNAGPGAVAGCFVHADHQAWAGPRFEGWWGHRADTRFLMKPGFDPAAGADGWQISNPPILALAPLRASLAIFREAGVAALRQKSVALTGFLDELVRAQLSDIVEPLTPADPARRGCQLSLRVRGGVDAGRSLFKHLQAEGIVGDWREPDVMRFSPVPLYNRFGDVSRLVDACRRWEPATT